MLSTRTHDLEARVPLLNFVNLKSLVLRCDYPYDFIFPLLLILKQLTSLHLLTEHYNSCDHSQLLTHPTLKRITLINVCLTEFNFKQIESIRSSNIEYLKIKPCSFINLNLLLRHLPQLKYGNFTLPARSMRYPLVMENTTIFNLIYLKLDVISLEFNHLKQLLSRVPNLIYLSFASTSNEFFIDGHQWQCLLEKLVNLKMFNLNMKNWYNKATDEIKESFKTKFWIDEHPKQI
ncbi:unnamed protein product [Didymodactylos carnosus]|uniref:Uncharacterized protein n=1 Tax=Didymodactylos carnosus TaxID=1234261 RepID=A0A814E932_9BILA|nr:unnamed protein product [Didymodactylos carnosus]CAF3739486.1 unnamed protein product [Didymodactylos carnosus]